MKKRFPLSFLLLCATVINVSAQQSWIVGGQSVQEGQLPWIGDLRDISGHFCGSALIDPKWVVTAGHCTFDPVNGQPISPASARVRFNTVNTNAPVNPNGGVEVELKKIFCHQEFSLSGDFFSNGKDIALIQLMLPVTTIEPIALPALSDAAVVYETGAPVKIAGWGISDPATFGSPDTMKFCNTKVFDHTLCNTLYGGVSSQSFCAGYRLNEAVAGAAAGDSGGPVWIDQNGQKKIIGVVSGGMLPYTSADTPGVYTKVAAFRPWIDSVINANGGYTVGIDPRVWTDNDIRIGIAGHTLGIYFGNVQSPSIDCFIFNAEGRKVYQAGISTPSLRSYTIDMSGLSQGLYIIRFYDSRDGRYLTKKIYRGA
ncbi:trypsin-like serine protease [Taibaiella koreensis]|uniref:trypsin-like serine protease n=1 Tax=Taibaiella koreensis TaxID=1268548 RepID=UPI000E599A43|nr:trypsin-like serine protease [Taibaiella koreensis]